MCSFRHPLGDLGRIPYEERGTTVTDLETLIITKRGMVVYTSSSTLRVCFFVFYID